MEKHYLLKRRFLLALLVMTGFFGSAYAATATQDDYLWNHTMDKDPEAGYDIVATTTFSIKDDDSESDPKVKTFALADVLTYPSDVKITMASNFKEDFANFGKGGSTTTPKFAITNTTTNLGSGFDYTDSRANRLYFHAPASQGSIIKISGIKHKPGTEVIVQCKIGMVYDTKNRKSKLALYAGPKNDVQYVKHYEFSQNSSIWECSEIISGDKVSSKEITIEIKRDNYNEGDDCVFYIEDLKVYGTDNLLSLEGAPLEAPLGEDLNLTAKIETDKFDESDLEWYVRKDQENFTKIEGATGDKITISPAIGTTYYKVSAYKNGTLLAADSVKVSRYLNCDSQNSKVLWREDFGIFDNIEDRGESDGVRSYDPTTKEGYKYYGTGKNVADGGYAVVANPWYAGCDGQCTEAKNHWFLNMYDHTQQGPDAEGNYGGMLLINGGNSSTTAEDVILQKDVEPGCTHAFMNFSAWFANPDWRTGIVPGIQSNQVKMALRVLDKANNGTVLGEISLNVPEKSGWVNGTVSFYNTSNSLTLQVINYGVSGGGNDIIIDDVEFTMCRPQIGIKATIDGVDVDYKNAKSKVCGGAVTLTADPKHEFETLYGVQCPFVAWMSSKDNETWEVCQDTQERTCEGSTTTGDVLVVNSIENTPMYYKAVMCADEEGLKQYLQNPAGFGCSSVVETDHAYVYCENMQLSIGIGSKCNEHVATVDNAKEGSIYKWEYGNENCGWTVVEGATSSQLTFDAYEYFQKLNPDNQSPSQADPTVGANSCPLKIKVTDTNQGMEIAEYVREIFEPTLTAEKLSESSCATEYRLTAELKDMYGENASELYTFYKGSEEVQKEGEINTYDTEKLLGSATYTVKFGGYEAAALCEASITLTALCDVMWPTIITPYDLDGLNDVFAPFYCSSKDANGKCQASADYAPEKIKEIKIFDRSGNMVADVQGKGWDGKSGTKFVMPGVYFVVATYMQDDEEKSYRGTVEVYNANTTK